MKYRLIREYPDSPELGIEIIKSHISNSSLGSYDTYMIKGEEWFKLPNPENYPEFWQLVVEKDYEILSLIEGKFIYPCDKYSKDYINQLFNTLGVSIHSVKRLSDGEIFTIGDKTYDGKITKFELNNNNSINVFIENVTWIKLDLLIKSKTPLFKTEDGVDIFEGDKFYYVKFKENKNTYGKIFEIVTCSRPDCIYEPQFEKYFSTKEKAEDYILMNKPCLSYSDIAKLFPGYIHSSSTFITKLKELVQQKLNNNN